MDTLPIDLINLPSAFLSLSEQVALSLFFKSIPEPRQCNNLAEAVSTNNWGYINDIPRWFERYGYHPPGIGQADPAIRYIWLRSIKYLNGFTVSPDYGPPLSLFDLLPFSNFLSPLNNTGTFDTDFYLKRCRETFREAKQPVVLPLVEHTPKAMHTYKGKDYWRYEPVVGSVCSMLENGFGNGSCSSWVVTDVIRTKTKEQKIKEIMISRITFVNSTTVTYDNSVPKMTCKFYSKDAQWSNPNYRDFWALHFDNFVFCDPGFIK